MNLVSYIFWIVLFYISIVFFVLILILMGVLNIKKNKYLTVYHNDDLFKTFEESGVKNEIYGVNGETKNYIKRYALRTSNYDKSFIANYLGNYDLISYFVVCYDKNKKNSGAVLVTERNNNTTGKIIGLSKKTRYVNIVMRRVDDKELSSSIIKPISVKNIRIYSLLYALEFFNVAYIIRHIVCLLVGADYLKQFYTSFWNFYAFLAIIAMTILVYLISAFSLRKKSSKNRSGGIRYEFN